MFVLSLLVACEKSEPPPPTVPPTHTGTPRSHSGAHTGGGETGTTAHTGRVEETGLDSSCDVLPPLPLVPTSELSFYTGLAGAGVMFDFDADGYLVTDEYGQISVRDGLGFERRELVDAGYFYETGGLRADVDGSLVVSDYSRSELRRIVFGSPPSVGNTQNNFVADGRYGGLEVGPAGSLLLYDGADLVRRDATTGAVEIIAPLSYQASLAWWEEGPALFVTDYDALQRFDYDPVADTFAAPVFLWSRPAGVGPVSVAVDACGNAYLLTQFPMELIRVSAQTSQADVLATRGGFETGGTLRWGSDRGVWRRDRLYSTSFDGRGALQSWDVGQVGGAQPVDRAP